MKLQGVSFPIRLDARGQRRCLYEADFPPISALVGLLGIDVPLYPHEVMNQVAELTSLGVLVEHVNRADTLILAEIDLAQVDEHVRRRSGRLKAEKRPYQMSSLD